MKNEKLQIEGKRNLIQQKAYQLAVSVVLFCKSNANDRPTNPLIMQLLRSGTSVGANIEEAQQSESKKDFIHKLKISLKEAYEVRYWLNLLKDTESSVTNCEDLLQQIDEVIRLLVSSIKTLKAND